MYYHYTNPANLFSVSSRRRTARPFHMGRANRTLKFTIGDSRLTRNFQSQIYHGGDRYDNHEPKFQLFVPFHLCPGWDSPTTLAGFRQLGRRPPLAALLANSFVAHRCGLRPHRARKAIRALRTHSLYSCARGGGRTHTSLRITDLKSVAAASYATRANNPEATMGFAPMYSGFADRRVSFFATWPNFTVLS